LLAGGNGTAGTDDTKLGRLLLKGVAGTQGLGGSTTGQDPMDADDTEVGWAGSGKVRWAIVDGEQKGVHCRLAAGAVGG
jgi:hypothetical protein